MKSRMILILFLFLLLLGGAVWYWGFQAGKGEADRRPRMWSVEEEKIVRLGIELPRSQKTVLFIKDQEGRWRIGHPSGPEVDKKRWGGVLTLVSGPKAKRLIAERADDLAQYGLDRPAMILSLFLQEEKKPLEILMGLATPQEDHYYMKIKDQPALYIMDAVYCGVLRRLAEEPPYPLAGSPLESARGGKAR